ncbi:MAG: sensor histidine kinase [Chloroflexi bacterium]|nr:sensor histidine kinase [Chloroflexota bacterium]MDA0242406.1 histidine kinase [Chloroflexota bacterium]
MSQYDSLQDVAETLYKEYDQTQRDLKEIDVLIKQCAAEVERLAQRNAQVTNYLSQMQLDTAPREDIKENYESLLNTQQRLFTMRGQLEKLQSDQRNLERLVGLQNRFVDILENFGGVASPTVATTSNSGGAVRSDQSNVIRVIQTEESARQSLVRKMHDGPASSLSNFILQAEICERLFDSDPEQARTELHSLKTTAAATFGKVKDFIFDLRPMMLDDLGVVPTLRSYVNSFQDKSGIPVSINITGLERRLESHIEVTIFRGVQELLNNARTHSQASQVTAQLDIGQDKITAVVEDNGSGFNVEEVLSGARKTIGLPTLQERIRMLNGEFAIKSNIGRGTRAEFVIPVGESEF